MSDLPALPDQGVPAMVGPPEADEWEMLERQAQVLAQSKLIPKDLRGKPEDVIVIGLTARELRIPMMSAMNKIHVIEGKPSISAELMVALVLRAGHELKGVETTAEEAVVRYRRTEWKADQHAEFAFTIEDAKIAGLLDMWFERWVQNDGGRNYRESWTFPMNVVENPKDITPEILATAVKDFDGPEWVLNQGPGKVKSKDNWWHYPKAMLWARAVSQVSRMQFPDVLMGVSLTPEELGAEVDPLTGEVLTAPADDAVKDALLARARQLPEGMAEELKKWFAEYQVPPITRLPVKWVGTVDDKIASFEEWVKDATVVAEDGSEALDQEAEVAADEAVIEVTEVAATVDEATVPETEDVPPAIPDSVQEVETGVVDAFVAQCQDAGVAPPRSPAVLPDDLKPSAGHIFISRTDWKRACDEVDAQAAPKRSREYEQADLEAKTVADLKTICEKWGLKKGGNSTDLIARILAEQVPPPEPQPNGTSGLESAEVLKMPVEKLREACENLGMELTGNETAEELADAFTLAQPFE